MDIRPNRPDPWWSWDDAEGAVSDEAPPIALDVHVDSHRRRVTPFGELDAVSTPLLVSAVAMLGRVARATAPWTWLT